MLGYKIREIRKAQNMTQAALAKKSGVSRVAISLIENGAISNVSSQTLLKIANALNVKLDEIFFDESVEST